MLVDEALQRWTACLGWYSTGECKLASGDGWILLGLVPLAFFVLFAWRKLGTAFLTLRALAVTPALSRQLSKWVKSRDCSDEEFMRADGAGERWVELRKQAIDRLAGFFQAQCGKSIAWGNELRESFSDLRFTDAIGFLSPLCG